MRFSFLFKIAVHSIGWMWGLCIILFRALHKYRLLKIDITSNAFKQHGCTAKNVRTKSKSK